MDWEGYDSFSPVCDCEGWQVFFLFEFLMSTPYDVTTETVCVCVCHGLVSPCVLVCVIQVHVFPSLFSYRIVKEK